MDFSGAEETNASAFLNKSPLTREQAALWFHHIVAPESVAYNLAGAVVIPGDTDLEALQRAFRWLAERHPMLRTPFTDQHGEPVQRIHPSIEVAFQYEDASGWNSAQLDKAQAFETFRLFDMEQGPAWRVVVFQQAPISIRENDSNGRPQDHLILLTLHHLIGNLWSIAIILPEIAALYWEETTGVPASLKPLRTSYADHVNKELGWMTGPQAGIRSRGAVPKAGGRGNPPLPVGDGFHPIPHMWWNK